MAPVRRAPAVILLERIGIEPGRHVAGGAGILVVAPDSISGMGNHVWVRVPPQAPLLRGLMDEAKLPDVQ